MIRLTLPIPPSANELFMNNKTGHGRRVAPKYPAWRWHALVALKGHVYDAIETGKWRMTLRLPRNMRGRWRGRKQDHPTCRSYCLIRGAGIRKSSGPNRSGNLYLAEDHFYGDVVLSG